MDAKSRDLALLSFLSLSCAVSAWAGDRDILARCFLPSVQSQCSARPIGSGADIRYAEESPALLVGDGGCGAPMIGSRRRYVFRSKSIRIAASGSRKKAPLSGGASSFMQRTH